MSAVPTIGITATGVTLLPVPAVTALAMPGFAALMESAGLAPTIAKAMEPPPPAAPDMPSAPNDEDKPATAAAPFVIGAASAPSLVASDQKDQSPLPALTASDGSARTAHLLREDDQPGSDLVLPIDMPVEPGAAPTLLMPIAAATVKPNPQPQDSKKAATPAGPNAMALPVLPAATSASMFVPATQGSNFDRATHVASAKPGPGFSSIRAAGSDLLPTPDASLILAPQSAAPAAATHVSVMTLTPDALLSQPAATAPSSSAGSSSAFLPSPTPPRAEMAAVLPDLAMAARPSGHIRLPRALPERDDRAGVLTIATSGEFHRPFGLERVEPQAIEAPRSTAVTAPEPAVATDVVVSSDRLGVVRIGIEGAPGDLRVSLGLSPAAAVIVAADTPRLLADLAAGGVRLQSLDLSGSGFASGQGPSPDEQHKQPQPMPGPRAILAADINPVIPVRAGTADRYA